MKIIDSKYTVNYRMSKRAKQSNLFFLLRTNREYRKGDISNPKIDSSIAIRLSIFNNFPIYPTEWRQKKKGQEQICDTVRLNGPNLPFRSFTLYDTFPHPTESRGKTNDRSEQNACWMRLESKRSPNSIHLLNSTRSFWLRGLGGEVSRRRRARSNLRQLSGGRRLDFANQEFVFPRGEDGNLERKKVRRSSGEQTTTQEKLRGIFRRDKKLSRTREAADLGSSPGLLKINYRNIDLWIRKRTRTRGPLSLLLGRGMTHALDLIAWSIGFIHAKLRDARHFSLEENYPHEQSMLPISWRSTGIRVRKWDVSSCSSIGYEEPRGSMIDDSSSPRKRIPLNDYALSIDHATR